MDHSHITPPVKNSNTSNASVEIGETELANIARKCEVLKGDAGLTTDLRNFAIEIVKVCAGIVDHVDSDEGTAGDEIRKIFSILQDQPEQEVLPAG